MKLRIQNAGAEGGHALQGLMSIQVLMNAPLLPVVQEPLVADFGEVELSIRGQPSALQFHDGTSVEYRKFALVNAIVRLLHYRWEETELTTEENIVDVKSFDDNNGIACS